MTSTLSGPGPGDETRSGANAALGYDEMSPGLLLAMGILGIIGGLLLIVFPEVGTFAVTLMIGWTFAILGVVTAVASIANGRPGTDWWRLLLGVVMTGAGLLLVFNPLSGAVTLTAIVIAWLIVDGIVISAMALATRGGGWGWTLSAGIISVLLGAMLWASMPIAGVWVLGVFAGVMLLLRGTTACFAYAELRHARHAVPSASEGTRNIAA